MLHKIGDIFLGGYLILMRCLSGPLWSQVTQLPRLVPAQHAAGPAAKHRVPVGPVEAVPAVRRGQVGCTKRRGKIDESEGFFWRIQWNTNYSPGN